LCYISGHGRQAGRKYPSPLSLRLDDDLRGALEDLAEWEERPVGMMARILLREAMEARIEEIGEKRKETIG
jgi:predicted transcriptional regulator